MLPDLKTISLQWRHSERDSVSNTSLMSVHSSVYSGADQRKYQSSASLAFVWGIHRWPVNSPHKRSVTRKMFTFDDVFMYILNWSMRLRRTQTFRMRPFSPLLQRVFCVGVKMEQRPKYSLRDEPGHNISCVVRCHTCFTRFYLPL